MNKILFTILLITSFFFHCLQSLGLSILLSFSQPLSYLFPFYFIKNFLKLTRFSIEEPITLLSSWHKPLLWYTYSLYLLSLKYLLFTLLILMRQYTMGVIGITPYHDKLQFESYRHLHIMFEIQLVMFLKISLYQLYYFLLSIS